MSFDHTIKKGTTSKIVEVTLRDSSTGAGKTGVAHSAVTASYVREGGTRTAISLTSGSAGDSYSSGKWAEVDSTNCRGLYQLHLPDAALATGVDAVTIQLQATGVLDKPIRISLIDADLRDPVRLGLTALPNAAAAAAGGLLGKLQRYMSLLARVDAACNTDLSAELAEINTDYASGGGGYGRLESLEGVFDDLGTRLTTARAGYLDNLNVGGLVASATSLSGILIGARVVVAPSPQMERPDSGSTSFRVMIYIRDGSGNMEAPDSTPTVAVTNNAGTDRSANLGSVTSVSTGVYRVDYTVPDSHAVEGLIFEATVVEGGVTAKWPAQSHVVDTTAVDYTAADRSRDDAAKAILDNLPDGGALSYLDAAVSSRSSHSAAAVMTAQMAESYAAQGVVPTPAQALLWLMQHLDQSSIAGTTKTVKRLDRTTVAGTLTLDDASTPTSISRAS